MNTAKVTPKDFVLWLGAMAALYAGVVAFISLLFEYINTAFPNPVTDPYYYGGYSYGSSSISYEIASLIVLTPVFLILMRLIRRDIASDPSRSEIWVRRWALFLILFIAAVTMVVDLIVLLYTFLQGEDLTAGFLLKVLVVLLVAGLGFMHFLADLRGYWQRESGRAKLINYGVGLMVVISIVAGFFIVGTPQEIRKLKQDAIRTQDLQSIQWEVVNYWQQKEEMPAVLADLQDEISYYVIPVDPKTKASYKYEVTGALSFKLCATFEMEGGTEDPRTTMPIDPSMGKMALDNWKHGVGEVCFDRTIDPERYPVFER